MPIGFFIQKKQNLLVDICLYYLVVHFVGNILNKL